MCSRSNTPLVNTSGRLAAQSRCAISFGARIFSSSDCGTSGMQTTSARQGRSIRAEPFDVAAHASADIRELMSDARRAQRGEIRLRVALVLADRRLGDREIFDQTPADLLLERQCRLAALGATGIH